MPSFIDNHTGGSGQTNQLLGLAVVNWLNAWAVGDNGTILSFDRLSPDTAFAPSNGWLRTPVLSLTPKDQKSGVAGVRWVVDPRDSFGNIVNPLTPWVWNFDWSSWPWQYGPTASFDPTGEPPGTRHVVYYQSVDNVGNLELDPFWLDFPDDFSTIPRYAEVPKHVFVTLDTIGPRRTHRSRSWWSAPTAWPSSSG